MSVDLQGLAGILLTNGLVANRALLAGVRRLPEGCHLCWNHTPGWRELPTYRLPTRVEPQHLGGQELGELIDGEIRRALHRHRPPQGKTVLMLSGGMDSRLMAGYLKAEGLNDTAITLGRSEDYEVRAATEVAAALSWRLQRERREPDAINAAILLPLGFFDTAAHNPLAADSSVTALVLGNSRRCVLDRLRELSRQGLESKLPNKQIRTGKKLELQTDIAAGEAGCHPTARGLNFITP